MLPARTSPERHHLGHGVFVEWLENGQIIAFTVLDSHQTTVDTYIQACFEYLDSLADDGTIFMLHDISDKNVGLTPYFRKRLEDIAKHIKEKALQGYSAVLLPDTMLSQIMVNFGRLFSRQSGVQQVFFTKPDKARQWLRQALSKQQEMLR